MAKILAKIGDTVYVREKSDECMENLEKTHPNKVRTWLNFSKAAKGSETFEDHIQKMIDELEGSGAKEEKQKAIVTEEEFADLCKQAYNKGISRKEVEELVLVETSLTPLERIVHAAGTKPLSSVEKIVMEVEASAR